MTLADQFTTLTQRAEAARKRSLIAAGHVTMLGASKGQSVDVIHESLKAGLTIFGENRVQEAEDKWPSFKEKNANIRLHLIGPLQTNKIKQAIGLFDVIETVDRANLADELADAMEKQDRRPDCLIQVNTGSEPQKGGVMPGEADALIEYCLTKRVLPLKGLMCIPPHDQPPAPHFALLRQIAQRHGLKVLSMGMSEDFETAIEQGATIIRLGRALFGERN